LKRTFNLFQRKLIVHELHKRLLVAEQSMQETSPNSLRHRIAALWREGMNLKSRIWAARGALERECAKRSLALLVG